MYGTDSGEKIRMLTEEVQTIGIRVVVSNAQDGKIGERI